MWQVSLGLCCSLHEGYRWLLLQEKNERNVTNAVLVQTARLARFPAPRVPAFPCLGNRTTSQPAERINRPRFASLLRLWVVHTSEHCVNGQIKLLTCATAVSHWCFELSAGTLRRMLGGLQHRSWQR